MQMRVAEKIIYKAHQIMACRYAADRSGENKVEHQGGDRKLGHSAAHGFFHNAIDAAADEHAATFHVQRAHRVSQKHHRQNEPRRGLAKSLFRDGAGVESRGAHVVEYDGSRPPERDEGEHGCSGHDYLGDRMGRTAGRCQGSVDRHVMRPSFIHAPLRCHHTAEARSRSCW
jgi:hypothetical protein